MSEKPKTTQSDMSESLEDRLKKARGTYNYTPDELFDPELRAKKDAQLDQLDELNRHWDALEEKNPSRNPDDEDPLDYGRNLDYAAEDAEGKGSVDRSELGMKSLIEEAKDAYERGDRTMHDEIEDEIQERLILYAEKYGQEASNAWLDRIDKMIYGENPESGNEQGNTPSGGNEQNNSGPESSPDSEPTLEELEAEHEELFRQYFDLDDKRGDEAQSLRDQIADILDRMNNMSSSGEVSDEEPLDTPEPAEGDDDTIPEPISEELLDETPQPGNSAPNSSPEQTHQEKLKEIYDEVEKAYGETVSKAMDEYAKIKATDELKSGMFAGRAKREQLLNEKERALAEARAAYGKRIAELKEEAGLYDGDEDEVKQAKSDDIMNSMRSLSVDVRSAVNEELKSRMENPGRLERIKDAFGKFFMDGGKVQQAIKGGSAGATAGFLVGVSGVGLPVTAAAMFVAGAGLNKATKDYNIKKAALGEEVMDKDGNAVDEVTDEQFDGWKDGVKRYNKTDEGSATYLGREMLGVSRKKGHERADEAASKNKLVMGGFAVGAVLSGLAGSAVSGAGETVSAQPDAHASSPASEVTPSTTGTESASPAPNVGKFAFSPEAATIDPGEGWLSQFADMGLSPDQAEQLFSDQELMNKLVENGAAYVDSSSTIGGYGINMSPDGKLSADAMKIISDAINAKNY